VVVRASSEKLIESVTLYMEGGSEGVSDTRVGG
jgi:hypothetical protein